MNFSIKELNELIYSLGITASKGLMCDKELNVSLLNKLYDELNTKIAEEEDADYLTIPSDYNGDKLKSVLENVLGDANPLVDEIRSHYVSNEEADEDAKNSNGITQKLLDYVDRRGAVSYNDLHAYYKIHSGSNSFSHILANLRIPYKNRKTQRYLVKEGKRYSDAKYVIKVANPSNWVEKDY